MKWALLILFLILLLSGCATQEEIIHCQKLCLENNMSYYQSGVNGLNSDSFSCVCRIIYERERGE